jgi:hypothetical protein
MPRPTSCSLLLALSLALLSPRGASAAIAQRTTVEELARTSDAVIRGKVERQRAAWFGRRIYTEVEVRTSDVWRGSAPAVVTVLVPGGVVGDIGQHVDAAPSFGAGEEVVVFLAGAGGRAQVNGLSQGKFSVAGGVVRPDLRGTTLLSREARAGERAAEEMPVAELERRVKEAR